MILDLRTYRSPIANLLQLGAAAVIAAVCKLRARFGRVTRREYYEPDPFVTEWTFFGDDLW